MGFQPSPLFPRILQALEDAQLEGQITTREQAQEYVLGEYGTKKREASSN